MKKLALLSLLFLTLFACRNDIDETLSTEVIQGEPNTVIIGYEPDVINVNASLYGTVSDENGVPMVGAAVVIENNTVTTDDRGQFLFKDIEMNQAGTFVKVNQNGYFPGSYRFFPKDGSLNYTEISLLIKENTGSFVSNTGGVVSNSEGIQVEFPANSVINANGTTYDGTVEVSARWLNPTASNLQSIMPGGLQGVDENLEEVALGSFGMMAVELESTSGAPLNLGNGQKATLTFPVPSELIATAPAEIPLWYFNETYGIWVQEGSATLQGNQYVGDVSHFSFWNCDAPFPLINLTGTLLSGSGSPLPNVKVSLTIISSGYGSCGWTDANGVFSGKVPQDEALAMTLSYNYNGCSFFSQNIGPYAVDADETFTIVDPNLVDVTGTILNCGGSQASDGWVNVTVGDSTELDFFALGGVIDFTFYNCESATELSIVAGNLDDFEYSDPITYTITNPLDLGSVSACGTVLTDYLIITVDDNINFFDYPWMGVSNDTFNISAEGNQGQTGGYVNFRLDNISAVGTYDASAFGFTYMYVESPTDQVSLSCNNGATCGIDEVVITNYPVNVGEYLIGTFSGTADFILPDSTITSLPYEGDFSLQKN